MLGWLLKLHANTSLFVLLLFVYSLWMDTNDVSRFFETLRMLAGVEQSVLCWALLPPGKDINQELQSIIQSITK